MVTLTFLEHLLCIRNCRVTEEGPQKGYVGGRSKEWEETKEGRMVVYCFCGYQSHRGED